MAVVAGTLLLLAFHARGSGALGGRAPGTAVTFLILSVVAVAERAGTIIKPELFSLLFLHLVLFVYFRVKMQASRGYGLWLVPVIFIVWVNSHGGFILLAPFLALSAMGELANRRFSSSFSLPAAALRNLLAAWGTCGIAVLATPYGWSYPRQLFNEYTSHTGLRLDVAWNNAYRAVLAGPELAAEHLPLAVMMALVLGALLAVLIGLGAPGARVDYAVLLINAGYVPLYLLYVRSTHWWSVVFGWSAIYLLARIRQADLITRLPAQFTMRAGAVVGVLAVAATLWLSVRTVTETVFQPSTGSWLGFGVSYVNPVAEADYLAARSAKDDPRTSVTRLYNIFDSGSYLLWRLYPRYRVMTDSRAFPYLAWFSDQYQFSNGGDFEDFLAKYPAEVAVIDHLKTRCQRNFLQSSEWRPVFYGPTAGIFVRRGAERSGESGALPAHGGIDQLRNGSTARKVFEFAAAVGDYSQAWSILAQLEGPLRRHIGTPDLDTLRAYRDAHLALARDDFERAGTFLRQGLVGRSASDRDQRVLLLLDQRSVARASGRLVEAERAEGALQALSW